MSERLVFELQAIDRATAPLKKVQGELDRTTAAVRRNTAAYNSAAVDTNKFAKGALQQAGYQLGDFFVQVTNGTSALQAFGQQGSQMLGIFGPLGAVAGAAVAIFAAVAVAFQRATGAGKDITQSLEELSKAVDAYKASVDASRQSSQAMAEDFGILAPAIRETLVLMREIALENVLEDLRSTVSAFTNEYGYMLNMIDDATYGADSLMFLRETLGLSAENARKLRDAFNELNTAEGPDETAMAAADLALELERVYGSANQIPSVFRTMIQQLGEAAAAAARVSNAMRPPDSSVDFIKNMAEGAISRAEAQFKSMSSGGGGGAAEIDPIARLREQLALEEMLLGKTEAQRRVIQALGVDWQNYGATTVNGLVEQINRMEQFNKVAAQQREIASTIEKAMTGAFMSMIQGTASVKDAFSNMARMIIAKLFEILVVQRIVNGIMGFVGMAVPGLVPAGVATNWNGGNITGGRPTVVGEKGPELIVPSRNAHVVANHQMGGGVTVVQNINVSTGVQQTVRSEIRSLMPQIAESAKAAVFESQRRSVNGMGYA